MDKHACSSIQTENLLSLAIIMVARKLFIDHLAIYLHTELGRAKLDQ